MRLTRISRFSACSSLRSRKVAPASSPAHGSNAGAPPAFEIGGGAPRPPHPAARAATSSHFMDIHDRTRPRPPLFGTLPRLASRRAHPLGAQARILRDVGVAEQRRAPLLARVKLGLIAEVRRPRIARGRIRQER